MSIENNKKLLILYVLQILKEFSDEDHPLRQVDIMQKLNAYGLECDRKTISANLDFLADFGFDIVKVPKKGAYLGERVFEPSEISFLVDAVFSSKSIPSKNSRDLATKLYSTLSQNKRKQYKYIFKSDEISRTKNNALFFTIDTISRAIDEGKKVEFVYNSYGKNGEYVPRQHGKKHLINPYFMVNSRGKYYLVCSFEHVNSLAIYKVEMITGIRVIEQKVKPVTEVEGYEKGLDIADFINKNIYMMSGESVVATLKIKEECAVNDIVDWFGKNARFAQVGGQNVAYVTCNKKALIFWCLQYGQEVELIEPIAVREEIQNHLKKICKNYGLAT